MQSPPSPHLDSTKESLIGQSKSLKWILSLFKTHVLYLQTAVSDTQLAIQTYEDNTKYLSITCIRPSFTNGTKECSNTYMYYPNATSNMLWCILGMSYSKYNPIDKL